MVMNIRPSNLVKAIPDTGMRTPVVDASRITRLPIRLWLSVRFSQPILVRPVRQAKRNSWEAHSSGVRRARVNSSTLASLPHASRFFLRRTGRASVRFPIDSAREKSRL